MSESPSQSGASAPYSPAPAFVGAALMIAWGVAQAAWMPSDGDPAIIAEAARRLSDIPRGLGEWSATDAPFDAEQSAAAGADGVLSRTYRNAATGEAVTVLLICGRPSHIAVHPPTACYRGIGYETEAAPRIVPVGDHRFASAVFRRSGGDAVEVVWGWTADGAWQAPSSPRITFAGENVLHKLYIVREVAQKSRRSDQTLGSFAALLVESLKPDLHPQSGEAHDG